MIEVIEKIGNIENLLLKNEEMEVVVSTFGCTIIKMIVEDKNGVKGDVVLGYDDFNQYQTLDGYLGALVGRVANRIGKGTFELNGETYHLPINNGPNSLHGGIRGFSYQIFDYEILDDYTIKFTYHAKDGEEGYPGNMDFSATYHLEGTTLTISYHATSDKDTLINITNHSYFNLNGHASSVHNHVLKLNADEVGCVDGDGLYTGELLDVTNTPFDFRSEKVIGDCIKDNHPQLITARGYDHPFVFNADKNQAELYSPKTGIKLTVSTTYPSAQVYSANYLDGQLDKYGYTMHPQDALCIETSYLPDSIHKEENPKVILNANKKFKEETVYTFEVTK